MPPGHKQSGSVAQNYKAQLVSAYNELGKELSSTKIKVVGNYTLGKVIGEGACFILARTSSVPVLQEAAVLNFDLYM